MSKLFGARQIFFMVCLFYSFGFTCTPLRRSLTTSAVVKVNDAELSAKDFAERLGQRLKKYDAVAVKNPSHLRVVKESVIDEFIHEVIVSRWAEEKNISISEPELDSAVDSFRKQYPNDLAMRQALGEEGISFGDWRKGLEKILLQQKVFTALKEGIAQPPDPELRSYYDSNKEQFSQKAMIRFRQIVFDKKDDADRLFATITKKTELADLAKKFSISPEAAQGGDTGWIAKGTLDIFDQAFTWPVGKRSPVLKSPYGFHIFEVIDKKPDSQLSFEQSRASIVRLMLADREQAAYSAWLEEQIKKAHVYRNDDLINSVSVVTRGEK